MIIHHQGAVEMAKQFSLHQSDQNLLNLQMISYQLKIKRSI